MGLDTGRNNEPVQKTPVTQGTDNASAEEFNPHEVYGKKKIFQVWEALARSHKKGMSLKLSRSFMMIGIVIALLLVIMQEFFLLFVIASLIFISNVLAKVPPEKVKYEISNHGILYGTDMYYWKDLKQFYFDEIDGLDLLVVDTRIALPGRLYITLQAGSKDKLQAYLDERLIFLESPPQTFLDKGYASVVDKFDLS